MKIRELLAESYASELQSDLTNLLIGAKAHGALQLSTEKLIASMQKMGYSVNLSSLMPILQADPTVQSVTDTMVTLVDDQAGQQMGADQGGSADKVKTMAKSASSLG